VFALIFGRERHHGPIDRSWTDDRPVFVDEPDLAILLDDAVEVGSGLFAEWAIVVEEGYDRHVAFGIASRRCGRVVDIHLLGDVIGRLRKRRATYERNGQYGAADGKHGVAARDSWHVGSPFGLGSDRTKPVRPAIHARHLKAGLR